MRADPREIKIDGVETFETAEDVEEAEGEQTAPGPLERPAEGRQAQKKSLEAAGPIDHQLQEARVDEPEILLLVEGLLLIGERSHTIKRLESGLQHLPELTGIFHDISLGQAFHQPIALRFRRRHHLFCDHLKQGRHLLRELQARLDVVGFLLKTLRFDQRRIIGLVVAAGDGGQRIEPIDQHALGIEIGEAMRPGHLPAPLGGKPLLQAPQQGAGRLGVLLAFEPAETAALVPQLARLERVDDAAYPAHQLFTAPGQKELGFGDLERRVLGRRKKIDFLPGDLGNVIGIAAVEGVRKIHPLFQIRRPVDFDDRCFHMVSLPVPGRHPSHCPCRR